MAASIAEQVAAEVNKQITPWATKMAGQVDEVTKVLSGPAKAAGITPQELFHRATQGRDGIFAPDGSFHPLLPSDIRAARQKRKSLPVKSLSGSDHTTLGHLCKTFNDLFNPQNGNRAECLNHLDACGVKGMHYGSNGEFSVIKAALAESSGTTGGYTLPTPFSETLLTLEPEDSVLEEKATHMPLDTRTLRIPSLNVTTNNAPGAAGVGRTNIFGGLRAFWESEAATIGESEPTFLSTELTAWQLSFVVVASITLLQDEAIGMEALLTQLFPRVAGWHKDYAFLNGIGVGEPLGINNCAATIGVDRNASNHFYYVDVAQMWSKLFYMLGGRDVCWLMHPSVVPELLTMNDQSGTAANTGRLVWQPFNEGAREAIAGIGPQSFGKLLGKDVYLTEKLAKLGATGDVLLVDPKHYLIGKRMEVEVAQSPHVYFLSYQNVWRIVTRCDGQPWLQNAYTLADGSYTQSPFVQLQVHT